MTAATSQPQPHLHPLLPTPGEPRPVHGTYLDSQWDLLEPSQGGRPVVYANFVTSLDGRIAVGAGERETYVPDSMTTRVDWRLFQELQAHADAFVTHGAYLRALAEGRLGNILQVGTRPDAADLRAWRRSRGLTRQPAVIVASSSLDFELPTSLAEHGQAVIVVTTHRAPPARIAALREARLPVRIDRGDQVSAAALVDAAADLGCRRVYLQSGPLVLSDMLRRGLLRRLYLTISTELIGGDAFHSLLRGEPLGDAGRVRLESLHHLPAGEARPAQLFAAFAVGGADRA